MALPSRCAASLRLAGKTSLNPAVYDRGSETLKQRAVTAGKSETYRASAWQSHSVSSVCLSPIVGNADVKGPKDRQLIAATKRKPDARHEE